MTALTASSQIQLQLPLAFDYKPRGSCRLIVCHVFHLELLKQAQLESEGFLLGLRNA